MSQQQNYLVDINLNKNALKAATIENLLNPPISPVAGQIYFSTAVNKLKYYNGTDWVELGTVTVNTVRFQGSYDVTSPYLGPVLGPDNTGEMYIVTVAGLADLSWIGIGGETVEAGDFIIYNHNLLSWEIIQANTNIALSSTTNAGIIRIATQTEVDSGVSPDSVVTPETLKNNLANKFDDYSKIIETTVTLVANVPSTQISYSLLGVGALPIIQVFFNNQLAEVAVNIIPGQQLFTITSNIDGNFDIIVSSAGNIV